MFFVHTSNVLLFCWICVNEQIENKWEQHIVINISIQLKQQKIEVFLHCLKKDVLEMFCAKK